MKIEFENIILYTLTLLLRVLEGSLKLRQIIQASIITLLYI